MNIEQLNIAPPFASQGGVSSIPIKPKGISNQQWNKYLETYNFAKTNTDVDPKEFADTIAQQSDWFKKSLGQNNYTNEPASKLDLGKTTKDGKYKNFKSLTDSLTSFYNKIKLDEQTINNLEEPITSQPVTSQENIPQESLQPIPQEQIEPFVQQTPNRSIDIPQTVKSLNITPDISNKIQSDMSTMINNPIQDLNQTNPKAYGGNLDNETVSPHEPDKNKSFNIGGTEMSLLPDPIKTWNKGYINSPKYLERLIKSGYDNPEKVVEKRSNDVDAAKVVSYNSPPTWSMRSGMVGSRTNPDKKKIYHDQTGDNRNFNSEKDSDKKGVRSDEVLAHEYGHIETSSKPLNNYDKKAIYSRLSPESRIRRTIVDEKGREFKADTMHDRSPNEAKSDLNSIRYQMHSEGIFDSFNEDATEEMLNKLKDSKLKERMLRNYGKDNTLWLLNNIAATKMKPINMAALGGYFDENMIDTITDPPVTNPSDRRNMLIAQLQEEQRLRGAKLNFKNKIAASAASRNIPITNYRLNAPELKTKDSLDSMLREFSLRNRATKMGMDLEVLRQQDKEYAEAYARANTATYGDGSLEGIRSGGSGSREDTSTKRLRGQCISGMFGCNPDKKAYGGSLGKSYEGGGNLNSFDEGNSHENNPLGGIPVGQNGQGITNTVEQGESSYKINGQTFIFSNRIII